MATRFIEGAFRTLAVAAGIGTAVAGCFTANRLITLLEMPSFPINVINMIGSIGITLTNYNQNILYTQVSTGLAVSIGIMSTFIIVSAMLRMFKCSLGSAGKCFLIVDLFWIFLCIVGFGAGGVLGAIGTYNWSTQFIDPGANNIIGIQFNLFAAIIPVRDALAATAAVSLFSCLLFIVLEVWMIIFTARHWSTQQYV